MSVVIKLITASRIKDLPPLLLDIIGIRTQLFTERFLDLDEKDRWSCMHAVVKTCEDHGFYTDRAFFHVLLLQEVQGEEIDDKWEEMIMEDDEENYPVNAGTQTETCDMHVQAELDVQPMEVEVPVVVEKQTETIVEDRPKQIVYHQTRGRPKVSKREGSFECEFCKQKFSTIGSLYNHHYSKIHTKKVRACLEQMIPAVQDGDKISCWTTRHSFNTLPDEDLSTKEADEGWIEYLLDYIKKEDSKPITFLHMCRSVKDDTGKHKRWVKVV